MIKSISSQSTCRLLILLACSLSFAGNSAMAEDSILIKDVRVFDGVSDSLSEDDVLVTNNLIRQIGHNVNAQEGAVIMKDGVIYRNTLP